MSPELIAARRLRSLFSELAEVPQAGLEATLTHGGPPGDADIRAISLRLQHLGTQSLAAQEADGVATRLVRQAREGMSVLHEGATWRLSDEQVSGFEAVLQVRGRPALRVEAAGIEDLEHHPGGQFWAVHIDLHRNQLMAASNATGSVRVTDGFGNAWGHGTGFLVGYDLVLTNRHVLIAPGNGQSLVQRLPGATSAQLKADFTVTLDFAFDLTRAGRHCCRVIDVPFISAIDDGVDAALLRIEPVPEGLASPLEIAQVSVQSLDHLYVIGHPGRLLFAPEAVNSVFGQLDECKRISFGRQYRHDGFDPPELLHDASTIGGYSGGPVLGFDDAKVRALHYWGDPRIGNRAISATALHRHAQLGPMLRSGGRV